MATPLLTATPGTPPTYNPAMAETFSWIPVEGAGRPLFAQATYLANPEDIKLSLSADNINVSLDALELNTDELEGKLDSANTFLSAISADFYSTGELPVGVGIADSSIGQVVRLIGGYSVQNRNNLAAAVADLDEIRVNTEFGTTSDAPLFVNTGSLLDTVDSISIDASINQTVTTALTSRVYVAGSRKVYNLFGITTAGVDQYIQLYDTGNQSPSGTPIGVFYIPANSNFSFDLNRGLNFTGNVLVVNSVTPVVYTPGNDDLYMTVIHN